MRKPIFRRRSGEGTPMILAIVLVLLMLFCAIAEFSRLWIIAQGVKEAAQQAVISTVNDNYDDVYHAVREGYAAGWYPDGTGRWDESIDTGDVYGQLSETLGLENTAGGYQKISDGEVEYTISGLSVVLENNSLGSGARAECTDVIAAADKVASLNCDLSSEFVSAVFTMEMNKVLTQQTTADKAVSTLTGEASKY